MCLLFLLDVLCKVDTSVAWGPTWPGSPHPLPSDVDWAGVIWHRVSAHSVLHSGCRGRPKAITLCYERRAPLSPRQIRCGFVRLDAAPSLVKQLRSGMK
ncbi:uncharacterized protein V6R79_021400 [Siganus canaliculatus]